MYQCVSGPRTLAEQRVNPCTEDCKYGITWAGCRDDNSCQGDLVCRDMVCSSAGSSVVVSKNTYITGETVTVSFQNLPGDRFGMAVFPAEADPRHLDFSSSEDWSWPCDSKDCANQTLTSGTINLEDIGNGAWKVYMIVDMSWPYKSVAITETFIVGPPLLESISTPKSSYSEGDSIPVSFQNPDGKRVWLGVFPAYANPNNLEFSSSEDWSWPCGSKDCIDQSLVSGTVNLENVGKGSWKLFLIADMTWPYEALTFSDTFVVES